MTHQHNAAVGAHVQQFDHLSQRLFGGITNGRLVGIELDIAEKGFAFVLRQIVFDSIRDVLVDVDGYTTTRHHATGGRVGFFIEQVSYAVSIGVSVKAGIDSLWHVGFGNRVRIVHCRIVGKWNEFFGIGPAQVVATARSVVLSILGHHSILAEFIGKRDGTVTPFIQFRITFDEGKDARGSFVVGQAARSKVELLSQYVVDGKRQAQINAGRQFVVNIHTQGYHPLTGINGTVTLPGSGRFGASFGVGRKKEFVSIEVKHFGVIIHDTKSTPGVELPAAQFVRAKHQATDVHGTVERDLHK